MRTQHRISALLSALLLSVALLAGCNSAVPVDAPGPQPTPQEVEGQPQATMAPAATPAWPTVGAYPQAQSAFPADFAAELDAILAQHPSKASAWLWDLTTGETYSYAESTTYYCASLLKAPYALWLCLRDEQGKLNLDDELPNIYQGKLADGPLAAYDQADTVPARAALYAMLCYSNNQAAMLLADVWPANWWTGFTGFLKNDMNCPDADGCAVTRKGGLEGKVSARDMAAILQAISRYFDAGSSNAQQMQQAMLDCPHDGLWFGPDTPVAKKYGSWTSAVHDVGIVYGQRPYMIVFLSDTGDRDISFPEPAYSLMQAFGRAAYDHITAP